MYEQYGLKIFNSCAMWNFAYGFECTRIDVSYRIVFLVANSKQVDRNVSVSVQGAYEGPTVKRLSSLEGTHSV